MNSIDPTPVSSPIGHELVGLGPKRVMIMNDWLCDTSTWDDARTFLDGTRFTFAFADLRGYGRSRGRAGAFTIAEAASDVLNLADALDWGGFAVVGHSMSALVALHLAQHHADRIQRAIFLDEHALLIDDPDHSEDERRFILLGFSYKLNVLAVCHCDRDDGDVIRIISARKADRSERVMYTQRKST